MIGHPGLESPRVTGIDYTFYQFVSAMMDWADALGLEDEMFTDDRWLN